MVTLAQMRKKIRHGSIVPVVWRTPWRKNGRGRREQGVSSEAMRGPAVFDARRLRVLK